MTAQPPVPSAPLAHRISQRGRCHPKSLIGLASWGADLGRWPARSACVLAGRGTGLSSLPTSVASSVT